MCNFGGNYMNRQVKMGVYTKNGEENTFNYYTSLRAVDKVQFVNYIVDTLVGDNYNSVIRDLVFDYAIINIITDFDTSYIDNSENPISDIEDLLNETNIVDIVKVNVPELIDKLNKAVDLAIEYKTGIHKNPIAESLSHLLNTLDKKVSGIDTEKMMEMAQVLSSVSGELNAEKVLEAYSKSEFFKQKYAQLLENKSNTSPTVKNTKTSKKTNKSENVIPMK